MRSSFHWTRPLLPAAAALVLLSTNLPAAPPRVVRAGCNCSGGGGAVGAVGSYHGAVPAGPVDYGPGYDYADQGPAPHSFGVPPEPTPLGPPAGSFGPGPAPGPLPPGNAGPLAAAPPPGTVGTTYRRTSRYVPEDKHPRIGMLTVAAAGATDMEVRGMKGFKDEEDYWHFETKEPMIPGVPHIYHVKAKMGEGDDAPIEFRTVRLIPGRIIDLDW